MTLRVVAIPLIAAICAGSPAMASPTTDGEQQVRGRGARDRGENRGGAAGGDNSGATRGASGAEQRRGGREGGDQRTATRSGGTNGGDQRTATRSGDRDGDRPRYAVPRDRDQERDRTSGRRDNGPVIVTRNRPNVNINIGSSYRGPRYYAPVHYDRWARQYYRWSPIGYAPWSLIYGSIGFSNFGYYGAFGSPDPFYGTYGYGYGAAPYSPWQASGYDIGGIRLKVRPRDAQVFVDGYYAGLVDDFDGTFQSLRLEQGGHKIEIHMPGFEDLELDVHVQPGRTITLSEQLRPRP
jgi:hypothetical protein